MADQDTCSRRPSGTSPASTSGRMRKSPLSAASIPLAIERTCMPGFSNLASCPPAQRTPNELTPLMTTSAPSKASPASSSWKALAARGTSRSRPGCTPLSLMLSMISRSRCVPIRRTSWPLSESGKARAVAIRPEPSTLTVVMLRPNVGTRRPPAFRRPLSAPLRHGPRSPLGRTVRRRTLRGCRPRRPGPGRYSACGSSAPWSTSPRSPPSGARSRRVR